MKITVTFAPPDLPPFVVDSTIETRIVGLSHLATVLAGTLHDAAFQFYFAVAKREAPEGTDEIALREQTYRNVDAAFRGMLG